MKIFLSGHTEDAEYLATFARLIKANDAHGANVNFKLDTPSSYQEFVHWCRYYKADAAIITNPVTLEYVLRAQPDFNPPSTNIELTLDKYQGSVLSVWVDDRRIDAVVLNPLKHLITVNYGKFLAERFLSKILRPDDWLPDIEFKWKEVTLDDAERVVSELSAAKLIGVDIETPTAGEWSELRGINCVGYASLSYDASGVPKIACYVFPFEEWSYSFIKRINDNPVRKVTQRGIYDNAYFLRWGLPVRAWYWDTYFLFHSWLSELPKDLALVAAFNVRKIRFWKDDGKSGNIQDYYRYNALDCWGTLCALLGILHRAPNWAITNYVEHEFPVVFPSLHCAMEGMRVDHDRFEKFKRDKYKELMEDLHKIQKMVGSPLDPLPLKTKNVKGEVKDVIQYFNPGSPPQLGNLFKVLGVGHLGSTDKAATLKARAAHPICDVVIGACAEWKSDRKIVGNYFNENKLWKIGYEYNGTTHYRLFYELDPGGTDTGRLASKASMFWCGFQIQNIPAKDTAVKQCLMADPGWLLGEGDYAQSEARCVGYMSGETKLIELVESENDYHAYNASAFFGIPYNRIFDNATRATLDKPLRDLSKRTNHGANYNMGPGVMLDTMGPKYVATAKRLLKLPYSLPLKKVCEYLLSVYEKTYPRVKKDWYASIIQTIRISGMLVSPLGWTRKFFGKPHEGNKQDINAAVAHGPQNLSVGIINKCFVEIWKRQIYGDLRGIFRLKAQIHDSILFQFRNSNPEVPGMVRDAMRKEIKVTDCFGITRTMVIPPDMKAGKIYWSELK